MTDNNNSPSQLSLDGSCKMVPTGSQFVWLRLMEDKKWTSVYQQCMLDVWRSQDALDGKTQGNTKMRKPTTTVAGDSAASGEMSVKTIGDIVIKKWCCTRTHQVLTRVFLTAEKYEAKANGLLFTSKEEDEFRRIKEERSALLGQICCQKLEEAGSNHLRDWLNRLWVLFVAGIDNDPAGQRALSYDVRKTVHDAQFTNDDAIVLQASLLHFIIPSLKYETCQAIAVVDFRTVPLKETVELTGFESSHRRSTPQQQQFTRVFISFVGCFLDTLTESELVKAASVFKPAIWDAQQRILKNPKPVSGNKKRSEDAFVPTGDGIHIDHLDKLGNRKDTPKYA
ncbi:hypothetical protein ABB37_07825 [Leptomonas pyrrhocoris]|uniref:Uncharacterized protein n=1 Tax=Leptomonas pyrrhocoris TaxID=157538 RepID=A0A0N0DT43_LEPPY|nr:hypothetical protein ABB37_07825 [Leptomonas pyrrhocoris]XP_015654971.1 hypothetical protein ABB37_07825 [Leptomonas pyrrhocoris]KPA76531.1 hypothetical protein ABB37_07825 [Leptomonas pyrrhocoris]KPA76532.1 hypothetical protein ABB37_07825 [Leptomonas pyrrhocoris]|eukprot:XP_015654970.1 hypothetical protein ABB37_07825 [Leptomonas pyrrhocoris]